MENNIVLLLVFLVSVFISSCSQIALKKSANTQHGGFVKEILNPIVMGAYLCFFGASLLTTFAYKGVPLSLGPVLEATSYIYVVILSRFFLGEKVTRKKILGNLLIIAGILIYASGV